MSIDWNFHMQYSFNDKSFAKIYRFYVIETPVEGVSRRGVSFKQRGINMYSLNASIKRNTPFMKTFWFVEKINDVERVCKEKGILESSDLSQELVIHSINSKHCSGNTDSLFYAIRCALAHGSFDIHKYNGEKIYMLENRDGNVLKARMIIKEATLLKWIELVD